jgi:hypothetical protein
MPCPADLPSQHTLDYVARGLAIGAASPAVGGAFKTFALPPGEVAAGEVTGGFKRTGHRLADSVRRHVQALLVLRASLEELQVLLVQLAPQRAGIREERDKGSTTALALSLDHLRAEQQPHLHVAG